MKSDKIPSILIIGTGAISTERALKNILHWLEEADMYRFNGMSDGLLAAIDDTVMMLSAIDRTGD